MLLPGIALAGGDRDRRDEQRAAAIEERLRDHDMEHCHTALCNAINLVPSDASRTHSISGARSASALRCGVFRRFGLQPIDKLDKYHLIILDDLCYVNRDQAETSALFELIAARYERRSLLVTANRPFGEWTTVFPDAAMTLAAVDRLVHHAVILEMNVESYRQRSAAARQNRRATSDSKRDIKHKEVITASST